MNKDLPVDRAELDKTIDEESSICTDIAPQDITNPDPQLQLRCNLYIHLLIAKWGATKDPPYHPERLPEVKRNLLPLLVLLRKSSLSKDLLTTLASILYHLQKNEYSKAEQCYMDLSIGKVAWPIGVASIGIHSSNSTTSAMGSSRANIMKDETTKQWIIQIKRLISFCSSQQETESDGYESE